MSYLLESVNIPFRHFYVRTSVSHLVYIRNPALFFKFIVDVIIHPVHVRDEVIHIISLNEGIHPSFYLHRFQKSFSKKYLRNRKYIIKLFTKIKKKIVNHQNLYF